MSALLELRGVSAGWAGRDVLRGVSLSVAEGEIVALVGANGAGKSTLLAVAAGVLAPREGEARLGGAPLASLPRREAAKRTAWLPQSDATDLAFTAREIAALGRLPHLGPFEPPREEDRKAIARALEEVGVSAIADRAFPSLSAGEKQRVLLARCLAQGAPLLLLDEPTGSLDVRHAWSLLRVVRERAAAGAGVLAAIHDLALAARACDRVVVLAGGEVIADGAPLEALREETLARAFGMRARVEEREDGISLTVLGPA
jgi:iron complex transport system ATP-binding protein